MRPKTSRLALWLCAWLLLSGASLALHRAAWPGDPDGIPLILHKANNFSHIVTAPGWVAVRLLGGGWRTGGWFYPAIAAGTAWAFYLGGFRIILAARCRALAFEGAASCQNPEAGLPACRGPAALQLAVGPPDSSRRRFLVDVPLGLAAAGAGAGIVRACIVDPWDLRIRRYRIAITDLPESLDGLRAVQIADTHLGPRIPAEFVQHAVDKALSLQPDVYLLTGDYIHAGTAHMDAATQVFRPLVDTGRPVAGVLGNHDWYGDGVRMRRMFERLGIPILDNRRAFLCARTRQLTQRPPASGIVVAGLADLLEDTIDADAALRGLPPELPCLLLSHNPDAAEMPVFRRTSSRRQPPRVDLMISGHTHGGQIHIPLLGTPVIPSRFGQKYAGGLVRGPAYRVLVSRGVGMSILPIRLGVPPEISEITFVRA